jgi:hypothetical protein
MSLFTVNVGNVANDGTGDSIRNAFIKVNQNFANLGNIANLESIISNAGDISTELNSINSNVANVEANVTLLQASAYTDANAVTLLANLSSNINTSFYLRGFSVNTTHANISSTAYVGGNLTVGNVTVTNALTSASVTAANTLTFSNILVGTQATKSNSSTGTTGQICWDANYIYVCVSTNTWKRVALSSF